MKAERVSGGESVDVVADASGFKVGDVVVRGELVLVATSAVPPFQRGGLSRRGGFKMPKAPGQAIPMGARVYWHPEAQQVTTDTEYENKEGELAECVFAGTTFADAPAEDDSVLVLLGG